jgi:hypothetical protein
MPKDIGEILSGEEPAQVVEQPSAEPSPEPQSDAQPRGEHGHFAPKESKEPEPAPQPEPAPAEQPRGAPPGVMEERNRRKTAEERAADLERQLAEVRGQVSVLTQQRQQPQPAPAPQPPPKPVDFWEDPNKFVESAMSPIQHELAQTRFELSLDRAVAKHGEEAIEAAQKWLRDQVDTGVLDRGQVEARLARSRSPMMDLVNWHQQQPANVEARLRAEIEAKVRAELGGQPNPAPLEQPSNPTPTVMPSNLVGQRNVGTRSGPAWSGPASINDIFDRTRNKKAG